MNNQETNTIYLMQDGELKALNDFEFAKFLYVRLFGRMMSIDCFDCAECGRKEWRVSDRKQDMSIARCMYPFGWSEHDIEKPQNGFCSKAYAYEAMKEWMLSDMMPVCNKNRYFDVSYDREEFEDMKKENIETKPFIFDAFVKAYWNDIKKEISGKKHITANASSLMWAPDKDMCIEIYAKVYPDRKKNNKL